MKNAPVIVQIKVNSDTFYLFKLHLYFYYIPACMQTTFKSVCVCKEMGVVVPVVELAMKIIIQL